MIRNDQGMVLAAFATSFGIATNEAQLRAIIEGLILCQALGISQLDIECDSDIIVDWKLNHTCTIWYS